MTWHAFLSKSYKEIKQIVNLIEMPRPVECLLNKITNEPFALIQGPDSHYGTKGLKKVVHETPTASKTVFFFFSSPGNNNGTSIEDGQIPEIIFYT